MSDLNKVLLIGRLGRDPETRSVGQTTKTTMRLASSRKWGKGDERKESTCWIDVEAWGPLGETCQRFLSKGRQIAVEGELCYDEWEHDGQKRSKHYVRASSVQFLGGESQGEGQSRPAQKTYGGNAYRQAAGVPDADLPF